MIVVPFKAEHLMSMTLQPQQAWLRDVMSASDLRTLEGVPSYSAFEGDTCVACAGVAPYWEGRYQAWAFLSDAVRGNLRLMAHVTRAVKAFLKTLDARRVELAVALDYEDGHAWAKHLGFELETPIAKSYDANGRDCAIYVKVR